MSSNPKNTYPFFSLRGSSNSNFITPLRPLISLFQVDGRNVGVWNFVDASDGGCKATHTGVDEATAVDHDGCYTFDGTGYATQRNIRNYDPRYLSVSMEFRSYDEDALLVLLVSDNQVRAMLICTQSVIGILYM